MLSHDILHGITRAAILRFAVDSGYTLEERSFTIAEALVVKEAFITSATSFVTAVTEIDGHAIGDGAIGPVSARLRAIYIERAVAAAI